MDVKKCGCDSTKVLLQCKGKKLSSSLEGGQPQGAAERTPIRQGASPVQEGGEGAATNKIPENSSSLEGGPPQGAEEQTPLTQGANPVQEGGEGGATNKIPENSAEDAHSRESLKFSSKSQGSDAPPTAAGVPPDQIPPDGKECGCSDPRTLIQCPKAPQDLIENAKHAITTSQEGNQQQEEEAALSPVKEGGEGEAANTIPQETGDVKAAQDETAGSTSSTTDPLLKEAEGPGEKEGPKEAGGVLPDRKECGCSDAKIRKQCPKEL